jgi:hypothetical protein
MNEVRVQNTATCMKPFSTVTNAIVPYLISAHFLFSWSIWPSDASAAITIIITTTTIYQATVQTPTRTQTLSSTTKLVQWWYRIA